MRGSIRVSEKHGVNPSTGVCFWCGEEDGTILLMGRLPNDAEAPRRALASYEPCQKCQAIFGLGIVMMEASGTPPREGMPPIQESPEVAYPTGRYHVLSESAVMRMLQEPLRSVVLRRRKCFIEHEVFELILQAAQEVGDG